MFATSILRPLVRTHKANPARDRTTVLRRIVATISSELREWRRRSRDRRALAAMSDRSLRDIGVTRYDATFEVNKPFWRP
jgi:uncharacterized protein YjiS (DUF1127 family)